MKGKTHLVKITIPIDFGLLRKQKVALNCVIHELKNKLQKEYLTGILNLLDGIQDEAVENAQATSVQVFGKQLKSKK